MSLLRHLFDSALYSLALTGLALLLLSNRG